MEKGSWDPVYVEKTCSRKEGRPSSHSQLLEGIYNSYDKKVNPIARTDSTRACSDCPDLAVYMEQSWPS